MEVHVTVNDKYLKAAAGILAISEEQWKEEDLEAAIDHCKSNEVEFSLEDLEDVDAGKLSIALAMYAIIKKIKNKKTV